MQLVQLQEYSEKFAQLNTEVLAVSTDDELTILKTARELRVRFRLIADVERRVISLFDVLHPEQRIARPVTFIIDKRGVIRYRYIGKDFSDRSPIEDILQVLSWM